MYRTKPPCGRGWKSCWRCIASSIDVCQGEQRKLATDLIQLNQSKQGAKVYQMFG